MQPATKQQHHRQIHHLAGNNYNPIYIDQILEICDRNMIDYSGESVTFWLNGVGLVINNPLFDKDCRYCIVDDEGHVIDNTDSQEIDIQDAIQIWLDESNI